MSRILSWIFPQPTESKVRKEVRSMIVVFTIIMLLRTFWYQHFIIPTGSMIPELLIGDMVIVDKSAYGYSRYSIPFHLPLIKDRIGSGNRPKRWDTVVFNNPKNRKLDYIKRCVGVPGDTIQLRRGMLYVNGQPCTYRRIEDYVYYDPRQGGLVTAHCYIETSPDGKFSQMINRTRDTPEELLYDPTNNTEEFVVPDSHYFMMGCNRNNSQDSRYSDPGMIPEQSLLGQAKLVFLSVDFGFNGSIYQPWTWYKIRFIPRLDRLGKKIVRAED